MYQTLMILLITAVTTIITTVVTVRITMTGRIFPQTAGQVLRIRAKRYGLLLTQAMGLAWCVFWLVYNVRQEGPVTRRVVVVIALFVSLCLASTVSLVIQVAWFLVSGDIGGLLHRKG